MTGDIACGIDIGGTKIGGALVDAQGKILTESRVDSPAGNPEEMARAVADLVAELRQHHEITAVGVGAAGYIATDRSTVMFAPNIAWRDEPLGADLAGLIGLPVVVENDANAAAWGEFRFGAGRDVDHQLMVTLGTGVGGGVVIDGRLLRGGFGAAAEIGHLCVVPGGERCGCGRRGCLEAYASGSALTREARRAVVEQPARARELLERAEGDPDAVDGPMVTDAAREGDPLACEQLARAGEWLGQALASLVAVLDPHAIVVGGGLADAGDLILGPARDTFRTELTARGYRPEATIVPALLGTKAGVIGAADQARI